jgi:hypothetical protein
MRYVMVAAAVEEEEDGEGGTEVIQEVEEVEVVAGWILQPN